MEVGFPGLQRSAETSPRRLPLLFYSRGAESEARSEPKCDIVINLGTMSQDMAATLYVECVDPCLPGLDSQMRRPHVSAKLQPVQVEGVLAEPEAAGAEVCVFQARAATLLLTP